MYLDPKFPKLLTPELAQKAVRLAMPVIFAMYPELKERFQACITVDAEIKEYIVGHPETITAPPFRVPQILYEESFGNPEEWEYPLDKIAASKSRQLAYGSNPGGFVTHTPPHLLFAGETPFYGGDTIEGISVACSGGKGYADKMASRIIGSVLVCLVAQVWENDKDKKNDANFVS